MSHLERARKAAQTDGDTWREFAHAVLDHLAERTDEPLGLPPEHALRKVWKGGGLAASHDANLLAVAAHAINWYREQQRSQKRAVAPEQLDIATDIAAKPSQECWRCGAEISPEYAAAGFKACVPCFDAARETGAALGMLRFLTVGDEHDPGHPHLINGEFQSDKYPTTPRGKVPLSCKDPKAQDLLWEYAERRRSVDAEFSADLELALTNAGYLHGRDSKKLTPDAFEQLIAEDRAWLSANSPDCLERKHIDGVLKDAIERYYPSKATVPMVLTCPACNTRHIDEGEFATKPHHTHECQACGMTWRPAVVPTVGVRFLFKNEAPAAVPDYVPGGKAVYPNGLGPAWLEHGSERMFPCGWCSGTVRASEAVVLPGVGGKYFHQTCANASEVRSQKENRE